MGKAQPVRLLGGILASGGAEFAEDRGHVVLDSPDRYEQACGDLLIGVALGNELEDLLFACG